MYFETGCLFREWVGAKWVSAKRITPHLLKWDWTLEVWNPTQSSLFSLVSCFPGLFI